MKNIIAHKIKFMEASRKRSGAGARGALVLLLWLVTSLSVLGQEVKVSGTVTDENGSQLPGVTIVEKGTANGATSDNNGQYTLSVAGSNSVLVFSFIGFRK